MVRRRTVLKGLGAAAAGVIGMPAIVKAQEPITLNGASQFNDDHPYIADPRDRAAAGYRDADAGDVQRV